MCHLASETDLLCKSKKRDVLVKQNPKVRNNMMSCEGHTMECDGL